MEGVGFYDNAQSHVWVCRSQGPDCCDRRSQWRGPRSWMWSLRLWDQQVRSRHNPNIICTVFNSIRYVGVFPLTSHCALPPGGCLSQTSPRRGAQWTWSAVEGCCTRSGASPWQRRRTRSVRPPKSSTSGSKLSRQRTSEGSYSNVFQLPRLAYEVSYLYCK